MLTCIVGRSCLSARASCLHSRLDAILITVSKLVIVNRHVFRTCMGTFLKARSTNIHPMEDSVACSRQVLMFGVMLRVWQGTAFSFECLALFLYMAQELLRQMYENKVVGREWLLERKRLMVENPMKFGLRLPLLLASLPLLLASPCLFRVSIPSVMALARFRSACLPNQAIVLCDSSMFQGAVLRRRNLA